MINYNWTCPDCGCHVIEEVITQTSSLDAIVLLKDGTVAVDYGNVSCDGGDPETIYYQCQECSRELTVDDMYDIAKLHKEEE